jgi:hypothetical protein
LYGDAWIAARAAWLSRDLGTLNGTRVQRDQNIGVQTTSTDLIRLGDGRKASLDASGVQLSLGVSYTFWGRR